MIRVYLPSALESGIRESFPHLQKGKSLKDTLVNGTIAVKWELQKSWPTSEQTEQKLNPGLVETSLSC